MKKPAEAWITVVELDTGKVSQTKVAEFDRADRDTWEAAVDRMSTGPRLHEIEGTGRGLAEELLDKLDISIGDRVRLHWIRDDGDEERTGVVTGTACPMIIIDRKSADNVRSIDTIQKVGDEDVATELLDALDAYLSKLPGLILRTGYEGGEHRCRLLRRGVGGTEACEVVARGLGDTAWIAAMCCFVDLLRRWRILHGHIVPREEEADGESD